MTNKNNKHQYPKIARPNSLRDFYNSPSGIRNKSRGQTIAVAYIFICILACTMMVVYWNSRVIQDKTELVNAADAVAYSAGVAVSRELNFLAYTNRAIIANHVTTGHLVSYKSWTDAIADIGSQLGTLLSFAEAILNWVGALVGNPSLGSAIPADEIEALLELPDVMAGITTGLHIATQQQLILTELASQEVTYNQLLGHSSDSQYFIDAVMEDVADHYLSPEQSSITFQDSDEILVNDPNHIASMLTDTSLPSDVLTKLNGISSQYTAFDNLLSRIETSADGGELNRLVDLSYQNLESAEWFTSRSGSILGLVSRSGSTTTTMTDDVAGWTASDRYSVLGITAAEGEADAKSLCEGLPDAFSRFLTFASNNISGVGIPTIVETLVRNASSDICDTYVGIPHYYKLNDTFATNNGSITLNVLLGKQMGRSGPGLDPDSTDDDILDVVNKPVDEVMSVFSEVEIRHERPICDTSECDPANPLWGFADLSSGADELPNLYNPFWAPRLVSAGP